MKILYVAHKPPVPNKDGGTFAMRQFADVLSDTKPADAFVIATQKHPFSQETADYLKSKFEAFDYEEVDTRTKLLPFLFSLLAQKSYILERFVSKQLTQLLLQKNYDLIVCDSLSSLAAVNKAISGKQPQLWVRSHNVEFALWQGVARNKPFYSRWMYKAQARLLKKKELALLKQVDVNLCISKDDVDIFNKEIPDTQHILLPIQVNITAESHTKGRDCYFIGADNWEPNIETVDYLMQCWGSPEFQKHTLRIAGGFLNRYQSQNIPLNLEIVGKVENAEAFALRNGILVAPAFSGSGIRVKLLEALSLGIPCITSAIGAQGISEESGLIIVKNEKMLLEAIVRLKSDDQYYNLTSQKGQSYVQKNHSFAAVKQILVDAFGE